MNRIVAILALLISCIIMVGCGGGGSEGGGGVTASTTITLQSITVTPANSSIPKAATKQFTAQGIYSDGSSKDISALVTWSSGTASVATVNTGGLATGVAVGTATITATSGSISGSTTLAVTSATLTAILITPTNPSIPKTVNKQFTAMGTYSDGTSQVLTTGITWTSGTTSVATINAAGIATGVATGTLVITATSGGISGSTTLAVTSATLTSIAISPASPSIAKGTTRQLAATGTYSDGTSYDVSSLVSWISGTTSVATINTSGLATGVTLGTSIITATSGAISGNTTLTVTPAVLAGISVYPYYPTVSIPISVGANYYPSIPIPIGLTQQFTAMGTYSDGTSQVLTTGITWTSSAASVATINTAGVATGMIAGTSTLTATSGAFSGSIALKVTTATLTTISVISPTPDLFIGVPKQFIATGTYSDGAVYDITSLTSWFSGTPSVATINASGLAAGVTAGTSIITATFGTKSASVSTAVMALPSLPAGYVVQGGLIWTPNSYFMWMSNALCASNIDLGLTGWRLPTQSELSALYTSGALNRQGWTLDWTWSATWSTIVYSGYFNIVNLRDGSVGADGGGGGLQAYPQHYITCVR